MRSVSTRSVVAPACGEDRGITSKTAVRSSPLRIGPETSATFGVPRSAVPMPSSAVASALWASSATTVSGPLTPGPNPSASRS